MIRIIAICIFTLFLTGCAEVALTGAGVAYDHYRFERSVHDNYITMQIQSAVYAVPEVYDNASLSVATFDKMVLLAGQIKTEELREQLMQIIATIPDIKHLYNFVTVGDPIPFSTNLHDAWLTAKVKGKLITKRELDAGNIKVVTEAGVVYILGLLEKSQADLTINSARDTAGVSRVVTMFEYIHTSLSPVQQST